MTGQLIAEDGPASQAPGRLEVMKVLKALADPVRLRLLELIAAAPGGKICVCDVLSEFNLSQPTISHHLKLLRQAELVEVEKRATWSYYSLRPGAFTAAQALLEHLDGRSTGPSPA